jgi:hypothetical protein
MKFPKGVALIALAITGAALLQTTLAANINLGSSAPAEFGQGIQVTTACSGSNALTIKPDSSFVNSSGAGDYYFSSVTVSNIPSTCYGVDFQISAYGETSTAPLALFNTTSSNAVVYNSAGTFERGAGTAGMTVTSGSGTFTATFTNPVAKSGSVFRITLQSGAHTAQVYNIGEVGPGGGNIFYYNASGFNCGATFTNTGSPEGDLCHYLEAAPSSWAGSSTDVTKLGAISAYNTTNVASITNEATVNNSSSAIGLGYKNSVAIVSQGNNSTSAAGAARAYTGGSKNDWYLPTSVELNQLCKWQRGVSWVSDATVCTGGTLNSGTGATGFVANSYWSSSEQTADIFWDQAFGSGTQGSYYKNASSLVRPIRAF